MEFVILFFGILLGGLAWYWREKSWKAEEQELINKLLGDNNLAIEKARKDSVNKSRFVIRGQLQEELSPLLPGFPYLGSDCKHLGSPVDFVVFHGMSAARDGEAEKLDSIHIVELKTGKAQQSKIETAIEEAIRDGRVYYTLLRQSKKGFEVERTVTNWATQNRESTNQLLQEYQLSTLPDEYQTPQ